MLKLFSRLSMTLLFSALLSTRLRPVISLATRQVTMKRTVDFLYEPHRMHQTLFDVDHFKKEWVHPDLLEINEHYKKEENKDVLPAPLRKELDGVYSFNVFTPEFIKLFNEEIDNFYIASERYGIPVRRPNSMNNYGVVVNEIGLKPLITSFQREYLQPLSEQLFPDQGSQFDDHHSFIVKYQADEDLGLDMHTDDSDVTFNVCLGEPGFSGSTLTFCGMFGAPNHRQMTHIYHHEIGRAVLHLGSRRHGADDIAEGNRRNLIVWNHNWAYRSSKAYKQMRSTMYQKEEGAPHERCLSYTHDKDYAAYKEIPERAKDLHLHPWCPPPGQEYEGYFEKMRAAKEKKKHGVHDPLDL